MILELESLFNTDGLTVDFDYEMSLSHIEVSGQYPITEPVRVSGAVKNTAGLVNLRGTVEFTYTALCDRCAKEVTRKYSIPLEHGLIHSFENEENDDYLAVPELRLDLDELVEEDVNLALPSKYLCSEDCKGLCPQCGADLNKTNCSCKAPIDPRLEGLLQFLN